MKSKTLLKSIISLTLVAILSLNSFAATIYAPGANAIEGPNPLIDTDITPAVTNAGLNKETVESVSKIIISSAKGNRDTVNAAQKVNSPEDKITIPTIDGVSTTSSNNPLYSLLNFHEITVTTPVPTVNSPAFIVVNADTKQVYGSKEANTKYEPAGITNLMTAYLGSINKDFSDVLPVTSTAAKAVDKDAFIAGLDKGDTITLTDAIISMFVRSCADSANVVAENVSGSIEAFVELMNSTAESIGCKNTHFVNPSGLNDNNQQTTAFDMAIIMDKVTSNPELVRLMSLSTYTLPATKRRDKLMLFSRNTILSKESPNYNSDVTCSRMGYTSKTGYTMASMCNYKGNRLIVIILNAKGSHFDDTKKLIDFAKLAYEETK